MYGYCLYPLPSPPLPPPPLRVSWRMPKAKGAVANRLRRRTSDQTVLGSNPAVAAALSPWARLFTPLSQGEAFTLASISYLAILVKYILAKKKKKKKTPGHSNCVPLLVFFCMQWREATMVSEWFASGFFSKKNVCQIPFPFKLAWMQQVVCANFSSFRQYSSAWLFDTKERTCIFNHLTELQHNGSRWPEGVLPMQ